MSAEASPKHAKRPKTGGRKRISVDSSQVEHLASIGMKTHDIAVLTGVSEATLQRRFAGVISKRRSAARQELIEKQWDVARSGDRTLLIWLGKNYAEQSDKADITSGGEALKVVIERIG